MFFHVCFPFFFFFFTVPRVAHTLATGPVDVAHFLAWRVCTRAPSVVCVELFP